MNASTPIPKKTGRSKEGDLEEVDKTTSTSVPQSCTTDTTELEEDDGTTSVPVIEVDTSTPTTPGHATTTYTVDTDDDSDGSYTSVPPMSEFPSPSADAQDTSDPYSHVYDLLRKLAKQPRWPKLPPAFAEVLKKRSASKRELYEIENYMDELESFALRILSRKKNLEEMMTGILAIMRIILKESLEDSDEELTRKRRGPGRPVGAKDSYQRKRRH